MPRRQNTKPTEETNRRGLPEDEWGGFVQANLSPADKQKYEEWYNDNRQHVAKLIDEHLGEGLKLSVTFDGAHNTYIASYTGRPNTDNTFKFRCTLSARAGTFEDTLALLVYKHVEVCGGDWSEYLVNGSRVANWG